MVDSFSVPSVEAKSFHLDQCQSFFLTIHATTSTFAAWCSTCSHPLRLILPWTMIVRSSRRSGHSRSIRPIFEQICLPWLCPALLTDNRSSRRQTIVSVAGKAIPAISPNHGARQAGLAHKLPTGRAYAYAATSSEQFSPEEYIPFERAIPSPLRPSYHYQPWQEPKNLSDIPIFDPRQPLIAQHRAALSGSKFRANSNGIGGTLAEIHQTLHACLQIGRLDRASTCLRTLGSIYKADRPELIEAHNQYLENLVGQICRSDDQELLKHMQRWFEVEIRGKDILIDGWTYALMIQASFQEANQKKIDRTVRRYIALAKRAGVWEDTLGELEDLLTDREIARATEIAPFVFSPRLTDAPSEHHDEVQLQNPPLIRPDPLRKCQSKVLASQLCKSRWQCLINSLRRPSGTHLLTKSRCGSTLMIGKSNSRETPLPAP